MPKAKLLFFLVCSVLPPFLIYFLTTSRAVYGVDSGDFIYAAWFFGTSHSPGYPIYTLLLALWSRIPFGLDPIFQMNLLSSIFHSLTIGVVFLILYKLTKNYFLSLISSFLLAFSYLFWTYSLVVEAFSLNDLFAAVLILVGLYFWEVVEAKRYKLAEKLLLIFSFTFALSLAHHLTIVLLLPGFLYLFFKSGFQKKMSLALVVKLSAAIFIGLLPYLYLPIAASFNPPANWGNPTSLGRFLAVVTRSEFGTFRSSVLGPQHIGFGRLVQIGWFLDFLRADFLILGVTIGLLGAFWFFIKNRSLFWFFFINFTICGPIFLFYADFPTNHPFYLEVSQRFVLISYQFFAVFLAFGFLALKSILNRLLSLVLHDKNLSLFTSHLLLVLFAFCFLLFTIFANWPKVNLSKVSLGGNFAHDALVTARGPAIMSLEDDTLLFNSQAQESVYKTNPNVHLILGPKMNDSVYLDVLKTHEPNLAFPQKVDPTSFYFDSFVKENVQNYEIYTIEGDSPNESGRWIPVGILSRFYPKGTEPNNEEFEKMQEAVWSRYKNDPQTVSKTLGNLTFEHIATLYATAHANVADEYFERGNLSKAQEHLKEALIINPKLVSAHVVLGEILTKEGKCNQAIAEFSKSYALDKSFGGSFLEKSVAARDCLKDDNLSARYLNEYSKFLGEKEKPI